MCNTTKIIREVPVVCVLCGGKKQLDKVCPACKDTGIIYEKISTEQVWNWQTNWTFTYGGLLWDPCETCKGTGKLEPLDGWNNNEYIVCYVCGGSGNKNHYGIYGYCWPRKKIEPSIKLGDPPYLPYWQYWTF